MREFYRLQTKKLKTLKKELKSLSIMEIKGSELKKRSPIEIIPSGQVIFAVCF